MNIQASKRLDDKIASRF